MSIIISNEFKQNIVNDYTSNVQTIKNLSLKYKLSCPTILKILKEYNIPTYSKQQLYSNGMNEDFFSNIDSEEKAYFLGFFLADGDGCFTYRLAHPERKICNSYSGRVSLITYYILRDDIINFLKCIGITNTRIERCNSEIFLEMVDIGRKNDILTFYNFIYQNATIYLSRKKEKFEQYFQLNKMI